MAKGSRLPAPSPTLVSKYGDKITQHLSGVKSLYQDVNQVLNLTFGQDLAPLTACPDAGWVACNINITSPGGERRWHYDRNAITGILYLNEVEGGETECQVSHIPSECPIFSPEEGAEEVI